jgi:hypothetical protein
VSVEVEVALLARVRSTCYRREWIKVEGVTKGSVEEVGLGEC